MKFWEAMRALEEGKKVRCKTWRSDSCIYPRPIFDHVAPVCFMSETYEEWELYEDNVKMLSFAEVVNGLKEGKKFRRKHWIATLPIGTFGGNFMCDEGGIRHLSLEDFEATDWICVEENK